MNVVKWWSNAILILAVCFFWDTLYNCSDFCSLRWLGYLSLWLSVFRLNSVIILTSGHRNMVKYTPLKCYEQTPVSSVINKWRQLVSVDNICGWLLRLLLMFQCLWSYGLTALYKSDYYHYYYNVHLCFRCKGSLALATYEILLTFEGCLFCWLLVIMCLSEHLRGAAKCVYSAKLPLAMDVLCCSMVMWWVFWEIQGFFANFWGLRTRLTMESIATLYCVHLSSTVATAKVIASATRDWETAVASCQLVLGSDRSDVFVVKRLLWQQGWPI